MEIKPQIKAKIKKQGNSYAFFVPKALVDTKVLNKEQEYLITIVPVAWGFSTYNTYGVAA